MKPQTQEKIKPPIRDESYLTILYAKALDSEKEEPILGDPFASEIVSRIDFNFKKFDFLMKGATLSVPIRGKHLDGWARNFLASHPRATVLHLGCGLDARYFRINPTESVRWYDIDLPEVMELRKIFYPKPKHYTMLATSVLEPEWLEKISAKDPVLVVAEGLVMHLPEAGGQELFARIMCHFKKGEFVFDAYNRFTNKMVMTLGKFQKSMVKLQWAIEDPHSLEEKLPGLRLAEAITFVCLPDMVERSKTNAMICRLYNRFKFFRQGIQHLRYTF